MTSTVSLIRICNLSYQYKPSDRSSLHFDVDWKGKQALLIIKKKSLVSGWLREGGAVLCSFIDWFLLLLVARCLFAWCLSRVSCVASPSLGLQFEVWDYLFVIVRETLKWKRWARILSIVMLESSSRSAPNKKAMPMVSSCALEAWRSITIEVS